MPKARPAASLLLLGISLLACLVLFELALRLTSSRWENERIVFSQPGKRIQYQNVENGIYRLQPLQKMSLAGSCYIADPVSVNAQGFRGGSDWPQSGGIALLGDSFVEGLQVADGLTLSDRLADITQRPVLNAGVSGMGTFGEVALWKHFIKPRSPERVVLFFYVGNDIADNSCALTRSISACTETSSGARQERPTDSNQAPLRVTANQWPEWRPFLRRYLALYSFLHDAKIAVSGMLAKSVNPRWDIYAREPGPQWEEAWSSTQRALSILVDDVGKSGAELSLVVIPEHFATAPNPALLLRLGSGSAEPKGFSPERPSQRAVEIATLLGIRVLDLLPVFTSYQRRHDLPPPYFSFSCDGHWNPLGHAIAAAAVAEFLGFGKTLDKVMATPPQDILGPDSYAEIYGRGAASRKSFSYTSYKGEATCGQS